jgi:protein TonB
MLLDAGKLPAIGKRPIVLAVILAVHVLLVTALLNGLAARMTSPVVPHMDGVIINTPHTPPPPPLPPTLKTEELKLPRIRDLDWQPPRIEVPPEQPATTTASVAPPAAATVGTAIAPKDPPITVLGRHQLPNTEDYYPAAARRQELQGSSLVRTCVDPQGRMSGTPQLLRSSGHPSLDEAALRVTRAGRYARAERAGIPVPNCYDFLITFHMN